MVQVKRIMITKLQPIRIISCTIKNNKALIFREIITRYGRKNLGFVKLFIEPLIFTIGISALWFLVKGIVSDQITPFAFALTGYSTVLLWRNSANRCVLAVEPNKVSLCTTGM